MSSKAGFKINCRTAWVFDFHTRSSLFQDFIYIYLPLPLLKMRILQLVSRFDFGGAENHVRELCSELVANNHEVILITRKGRQKELLDKRVIFIQLPLFVRNLILTQAAIIVYLLLRYKIDVIHAHQRLPVISACMAGFIARVPVVATVHGRVRHDLRSAIARKQTSRIIFVSNQVLTISRYYETLKHKSVVIPNGIPIPKAPATVLPFTIGYYSRIDTRHFEVIKYLVSAVEQLKDEFPEIKLLLVGDGNKVENLKRLIDETNKKLNAEVIRFKGFIEKLDDCIELPELVVGVGRTAIEALTRGASVISVNFKRMGDIITMGNYGDYAKNNFVNIAGTQPTPQRILNQIKLYFEKRDTYRAETHVLAQKVKEEFCISNTTEKVIEIYSSISKKA